MTISTQPKSPWIQYWQPKPQARLRLFCFPYAGGGASIFRTWSESLPSEVEVWPVQLPGRESRILEKPFTRLDSLIASLEQALLPYLKEPYAFFGHSMGTLISFELTRALRRRGDVPGPVHLYVSGHRAPQLPDPDPAIHDLPEQEFIEALRRLQGTPEEVLRNTELLQLLIPPLRADFAVCETYTYTHEKPLMSLITALGGLEDDDVPRDSVAAWREQTNGPFKLRFFVGGHFFLHKERASLLSALSQDLLNDLREQ